MAVEDDDFRYLLIVYLPGTAQAQHMLRMLPAVRVANARLAGEKGLESFALQVLQQGDCGYVGVLLASGSVLVFSEDAGDMEHQFFTG